MIAAQLFATHNAAMECYSIIANGRQEGEISFEGREGSGSPGTRTATANF
jgi:hypothetical protein